MQVFAASNSNPFDLSFVRCIFVNGHKDNGHTIPMQTCVYLGRTKTHCTILNIVLFSQNKCQTHLLLFKFTWMRRFSHSIIAISRWQFNKHFRLHSICFSVFHWFFGIMSEKKLANKVINSLNSSIINRSGFMFRMKWW